jgi:hypothetical protein
MRESEELVLPIEPFGGAGVSIGRTVKDFDMTFSLSV